MARYNFISDNDFDFVSRHRPPAETPKSFRGADLNYLACKYAIHRKLHPPGTDIPPRTDEFMADHDEDDGDRPGWLNRLFQRLATLGETHRPQIEPAE